LDAAGFDMLIFGVEAIDATDGADGACSVAQQ
jgi:hypothetical protein